ncbi:hypothetical protein EON65_58060 [archaeon]|nr:MAG: hypothetical protein EON65_58060 [archaeon]
MERRSREIDRATKKKKEGKINFPITFVPYCMFRNQHFRLRKFNRAGVNIFTMSRGGKSRLINTHFEHNTSFGFGHE